MSPRPVKILIIGVCVALWLPETIRAATKVIIDTDPGVDDALAVMFAFRSPELDVLALTTIFGNVETELATINALRLVEMSGKDIPVAAGAVEPWYMTKLAPPDFVHGKDGLGNVNLSPPRGQPTGQSAAALIVETVMAHPGEVTLVVLGPMTNIALALALEPELPKHVKSVVAMGGVIEVMGNVSPVASANILNDPHAADIVLGTDWNVTLVPGDTTRQVRIRDDLLERIRDRGGSTGRFLHDVSLFYRDYYRSIGVTDGFYAHDPTAMAFAIDPGLFGTEIRAVRVVTEGMAIGEVIAATERHYSQPGPWFGIPKAHITTDVDSQGVLELFERTLLGGETSAVQVQSWECSTVMAPMRDGVRLATDVYLPKGQGRGPFPVVLSRTPYDKGDCANVHAQYFATRGYVAMVQDERGRHDSEGEYYWLMDEGWGERRDGYDTIEWAAAQPYSNGRVGTMGLSFTCANQFLTAPTRPPHLEAMFCAEYSANSYRDVFWPGGALHMVLPTWLLTQGEMVKPLRENVPGHGGYLGSGDAWSRWYDQHIESENDFTASMFSDMYNDLIGNPYYNDYWRRLAVDERWGDIDVPIYHLGGWYDRHVHGTVRHYNGILEQGGDRARAAQRLIIGPWTHGTGELSDPRVGALSFPDSPIDYDALRLRWFDYHLKGLDNGIMDEPPVRIYVMGDNVWRDEAEFPLSRQVETSFYFTSGPSGSIGSLNDGLLRLGEHGEGAPDRYEYDPARPVPTLGGDLFVEPEGAQDHRPADRRSLTYTTAPLEEDVEVTGFSRVELFASSSAVDTDWVVTLIDVHPSGFAQHLRQTLLRARYRDGDEAPSLMEPGEIYPFTIEIHPLSNVFKKGHRIRLTVTSSSFPKWYPNGNTGREMLEDRPGVIATNTIYHDREHPSRLVVPVIPRP